MNKLTAKEILELDEIAFDQQLWSFSYLQYFYSRCYASRLDFVLGGEMLGNT